MPQSIPQSEWTWLAPDSWVGGQGAWEAYMFMTAPTRYFALKNQYEREQLRQAGTDVFPTHEPIELSIGYLFCPYMWIENYLYRKSPIWKRSWSKGTYDKAWTKLHKLGYRKIIAIPEDYRPLYNLIQGGSRVEAYRAKVEDAWESCGGHPTKFPAIGWGVRREFYLEHKAAGRGLRLTEREQEVCLAFPFFAAENGWAVKRDRKSIGEQLGEVFDVAKEAAKAFADAISGDVGGAVEHAKAAFEEAKSKRGGGSDWDFDPNPPPSMERRIESGWFGPPGATWALEDFFYARDAGWLQKRQEARAAAVMAGGEAAGWLFDQLW